MQNPVTFMPTATSGNTVKQIKSSTNSGETPANSFKQALSKEISVKQNAVQDRPTNTEENKAVGTENKTNVSKDPTTIKSKDEDQQKDDVALSEDVQTNGVQMIALVENLVKFLPKIAETKAAAQSTEVPSIDTNVTGIAAANFNQKTDPTAVIQDKSFVKLLQSNGNTPGVADDNNLNPLSSAERVVAPTFKSDESNSKESPQLTNKAGIELPPELKTAFKEPVETDLRTDLKVNFTVDMKPDRQPNVKQNLQPDLNANAIPNVNTDLLSNLRTDITSNLKNDLLSNFKVDITPNQKTELKTDPTIELTPDLKTELRVSTTSDLKTELKTDLKASTTPDLKTELKTDLKASTTPDLKTELKTDLKASTTPELKTELKTDLKISTTPDLKTELKTDLKTSITSDLKTELKPHAKILETGNIKEQSVKIAEIPPAVQNFGQQINMSSAQINAASEVMHLAPRVGTPAWNQTVGQKIIWMVAGGQQTAELTLNPPDLGPMQVVLSVNNDQANATFISAHPDVREALESAMPKLRQMMSDAGVQLSGFSVKSDSSNPGTQFAGDRSSPRPKSNTSGTLSGTSPISATTNVSKKASGNGIVDTFA